MIKTVTVNPGQEPTPEQLQEVEEAKNQPIMFDEDCEELSPAMLKAFKSSVTNRKHRQDA